MTFRSSSVSFPHFSLILPFNCFQSPAIVVLFMASLPRSKTPARETHEVQHRPLHGPSQFNTTQFVHLTCRMTRILRESPTSADAARFSRSSQRHTPHRFARITRAR